MADLVVIDSEPTHESVVQYLEDLLVKAREGKFSAISFAYVYRDGTTGSAYSVQHNLANDGRSRSRSAGQADADHAW